MTRDTVTRIVALGAVTGMRSMAGMATLALAHPGMARAVILLAATGEMIADKTPFIGARTDAAPLAARVVIGAGIGAVIAREQDQSPLIGSVLGAAAALAAAHLAYHGRRRLNMSSVAGGLIEDGLVLALASRCVSPSIRR